LFKELVAEKTIGKLTLMGIKNILQNTIVFAIIGMRGEIDSKFELLVVDRSSPKNIQIVSF
jgi:hypothetical protein